MPKMLEGEDWDIFLKRIKNGKCTPFLGSGVCAEKISVISQIANEWAKKYDYPMENSYDLARVAQFVAVVEDLMTPKEEVCKKNQRPVFRRIENMMGTGRERMGREGGF